ncbi:MAG TPA: MFS transporter [Acidimicrobiales bacterium]|nr:MFS transporter [Acidimicrobiales bacterium]
MTEVPATPRAEDGGVADRTATAAASPRRRGFGAGFWFVAYAFLVVMASATLPSPLYGLYRLRDGLSALMITVIYAIFAVGTIATLLCVGSIAARVGRRGVMLGAVVAMMAAVGVLAAWQALPGLLIGRLVTGVAVGLAAGSAITYLIELRLRSDPGASIVGPRTIGTSVSVGALGIGPLIAGCIAQWTSHPLTLPYLVFLGLGASALVAVGAAPETSVRATPSARGARTPRRARLPVPAAAGTMSAFAASGLFAGLSGLILATTLGHPSHALAGVTLFIVFTCGVASQLATARLHAAAVLAIGTASMLCGLVCLVVAVRLSSPSLALFLVGGGLIGAGAGAVFKGTTGIVLEASEPQDRLAMTSALLVVLFTGLSVPIVGAGIALDQGASTPNTVLGFAVLVALGVSASGWAMLRPRPAASRPAT